MDPHDQHVARCESCQRRDALDFDFTMAFQPIVDVEKREVFAYEALVRGTDGSGAYSILSRVDDHNRYSFDQRCRVKAVELAARLGIECFVSINFLPNAVYEPATCIRATLAAAERNSFPPDRIIFELTESEEPANKQHLLGIMEDYSRRGFTTAIDDFGAGYSGLTLLADFQPDIVKLDMALIRDIHIDTVRQAIVEGVLDVCRRLDIGIVAEGVETIDEYVWLVERGVRYIQGYLLAKPGFEELPAIDWPEDERVAAVGAPA
ncbi:EAL domain-containing protein [Salinibacterium sp. SYSU T00001]|uniref:EAL domain-containing protein n=1 Tax=Homoserinimonas sedimenticola TaxID=2986805 RepID=UPI0022355458|nr:EAL domain-containing protein [Salinibacterium sedimenticola]MCW4384213.1 EAL domain-containing protein [Salinibacterium sedimenticola]